MKYAGYLIAVLAILAMNEGLVYANTSQDKVIISHKNTQSEQEVKNYWTPDRIKDAKPTPLPILTRSEFNDFLERNKNNKDPIAQPMFIPGSPIKNKNIPNIKDGGQPYRSNINISPYWNGGQLFMGNDPFGTQWCTAEYVGNHRILLTAAHCVMDTKTGNWKSNFKFIQQASRMDGGYWRYAKNETVWSDFYNNGKINWAHDYAFICTTKDSAFGWMGFAANENYNDWTSIGYPGNYGNGLYMYQVDGNNGGITNNVVKMLNNPMGPGSSGGAWIYNPSSDRFANSVNSFEYSGEPNNTYGPYFDMDAWTLYQYAVDHCPGA